MIHGFIILKCDFKGSCQIRLNEHTDLIHEGVKYMCNQCNDWFEKTGLNNTLKLFK